MIVDCAVADMRTDSESGPQLATHARHNVILDQVWLKSELDIERAPGEIDQLRKMDASSNLSDRAELGRIDAAKQVKPEHLPAAFDLLKAQA